MSNKVETRGRKPSENSMRARLGRIAPGTSEAFIATGDYPAFCRQITAALARHYADAKLEFSIRKAFLVFDENECPRAVAVVTRNGAL